MIFSFWCGEWLHRLDTPVLFSSSCSHRYSSYKSNIKYVDSIIKCIGFESFYYAINLNVISFFMIFNDFDLCIISLNKRNYSSFKKKSLLQMYK